MKGEDLHRHSIVSEPVHGQHIRARRETVPYDGGIPSGKVLKVLRSYAPDDRFTCDGDAPIIEALLVERCLIARPWICCCIPHVTPISCERGSSYTRVRGRRGAYQIALSVGGREDGRKVSVSCRVREEDGG